MKLPGLVETPQVAEYHEQIATGGFLRRFRLSIANPKGISSDIQGHTLLLIKAEIPTAKTRSKEIDRDRQKDRRADRKTQ